MRKCRTKRLRRTAKQVIKFGTAAKRKHTRKAGRTGKIFSKKLNSRK